MKVMILTLSGFEMLEFSAFADVLGWAKLEGGLDIEYDTAGFSREVTSAFEVPMKVDRVLWRRGAGVCCPVDICEADYDALAIPGGFEEYGYYDEAYRDETTMLIRAFHKAGKPIATVCVGALALGNAGVLEGRRATTYGLSGGHRQKQLAAFGADVQAGDSIVVDGNLITSCGPSTATNVAFLLLEKLTDKKSAEKVRELMGFGARITYRQVKPADNLALKFLVQDGLASNGLAIPGTAYFDPNLDDLCGYYMSLPGKRNYFVAETEDGRVVGGCGVDAFEGLEDTAELQKLYVASDARGHGIAGTLVRMVEEEAGRLGYKRIYIETHSNLQAALKLYEREGYTSIERPPYAVHQTMDCFLIKEL